MPNIAELPGIDLLWQQTQGRPEIRVAILDGLVDQTHPCFVGAQLSRRSTLVRGTARADGSMSRHGTHVASIIFGQPGSSVQGLAPRCQGLVIPVFSDDRRKLSQLDLSRAIEQAVNAEAHIINISGGQLTEAGEAESWLQQAAKLCQENNILLVAAAGNDGCDCLHVPAALPAVLAVGAMDDQGHPLNLSNWGSTYQFQGLLAPGFGILGAKPGGGVSQLTGTSFAAPIVTGVAALLLSLQVKRGQKPNPKAVRTALLTSASPCDFSTSNFGTSRSIPRCLGGKLNIAGALNIVGAQQMTIGGTMPDPELTTLEASGCGCGGTVEVDSQSPTPTSLTPASLTPASPAPREEELVPAAIDTTNDATTPSTSKGLSTASPPPTSPSSAPNLVAAESPATIPTPSTPASVPMNTASASVTPSQVTASVETGLVYVIGTLGYDFGTEARRDSFKQLMPGIAIDGIQVPANPYDARQMADYLGDHIAEAKSLIWTLNLELTPIYAIEPSGPFARDVYQLLQTFLAGQVQAESADEFIERVSIPARLTGRTVRLFSGQMVPVVEPQNTRGLFGWEINQLVQAAIDAARDEDPDAVDEEKVRKSLESFLNRVYYDLRNLGSTSQDRALNFAATNAFQAAQTCIRAVVEGMQLDSITVTKSPFCRMDSDCWDVQLKFFDPENRRRARRIFRFTIDVSDTVPVSLGEVRSWTSAT
jgi:cyanobactin maturation PatA/PatG family protease